MTNERFAPEERPAQWQSLLQSMDRTASMATIARFRAT
jgi:hypothetical protein